MIMSSNGIPFYLQVRDKIFFEIGERYEVNDKLPSESDWVDKFNVHRGTVRKALELLVNEGIIYKKRGSGAFVATKELPLKKLTGPSSINLGICYHGGCENIFLSPFYGKFINALLKESDGELNLVFCQTDGNVDSLSQLKRKKDEQNLNGLIVMGAGINDTYIEYVKKMDLRTVLVDAVYGNDSLDSVSTDNLGGSFSAIEHLSGLGHRHIAMLTGIFPDQSSIKRFQGYKLGLMESDLEFDQSLVQEVTVMNSDGGYEAMLALLSRNSHFSALFCHNDLIAIGAMRAAQEKGLRIPEDLNVVGFDDIDMAALTNPPLTTVRIDVEQMAIIAFQRIMTSLKNPDSARGGVMMRTKLIHRKSTSKVSSLKDKKN